MSTITVYQIRSDGVFGGDVELVVNDPVMSPIPAGCTRSSPHPIPAGHYAVMQGGWRYIEGETPAPIDTATPAAWAAVRAERDAKLSACDWTQLPDAPVDAAAWATYRQALRDLPQTQTDPFNIVWPEQPA
jgi:hypothetical protein